MFAELLKSNEGIFIDPTSNESLIFNEDKMCIETKNHSRLYSITDGIIILLDENSDQNSLPYDKFSKNYDPWILGTKFSYKILKRIIWNVSDEFEYTNKVVRLIPEEFDGIILDVPVGTGIFTVEKYKQLKKATIIVIDYSLEMLKLAKKRFEQANIKNVIYFQGDVCKLPLSDGVIDMLVSMSGLESFREKERAIQEMSRVIKSKGRFIGCTYVKGKKLMKDIFSKLSTKRTGLLLGPFYTEKELLEIFSSYFEIKQFEITKSIMSFDGIKK
ncbi:MAG: class I SAM-dependent methyltransferase [Candidatus Thorarchaeota archaeon]